MYIILNLFVLDCLKSLTAPKQVIRVFELKILMPTSNNSPNKLEWILFTYEKKLKIV